MAATAAKETDECPDGKEKSFGTGISSSTDGSIQQGLSLATRFLTATLQIRKFRTRATAIVIPQRRYFGRHKNRTVSAIQNHPPLPSEVIPTISRSSRGWCSPCRKYSISNSIKFLSVYPSATSSTIISTNPTAKAIVPILECSPSTASGTNSSTTT